MLIYKKGIQILKRIAVPKCIGIGSYYYVFMVIVRLLLKMYCYFCNSKTALLNGHGNEKKNHLVLQISFIWLQLKQLFLNDVVCDNEISMKKKFVAEHMN